MALTWADYWTEYGPHAEEADKLKASIKDPIGRERTAAEKKLKKLKDLSSSLDWLYGYTKHVAVIIARFCRDTKVDLEVETNVAVEAISEGKPNPKTPEVRVIAFGMLKKMEKTKINVGDKEVSLLDVFDECVLPIKPRPYGAIPRAFLGGDVAESGEGLGFMQNKLRRYVRHPSIVPKATLLSWKTYEENQDELSNYSGWYYSIKYDGWSAIWTGTKLVTANGRQTITTMPEEMQNALLTVRYPLVGELVLLQKVTSKPSEKYTKERLQALVRGERTADVAKRDEIAKRVVFMVYDTPSTEHSHQNYKTRLKFLKDEVLIDPVSKNRFSVEKDRVQLIQQKPLTRPPKGKSITETLGDALFAATAAEQEGLILTPNEPYLRLYQGEYRRRKLKPLYQFSVVPDDRTLEDSEKAHGATLVKQITVSIPGLPQTFTDRNTKTKELKINVEGDVWVESTKKTKCLRLSKHRWGFHPVITDPVITPETTRYGETPLVLPKAMITARNNIFNETVESYALPTDERNIQLWTLVASHLIHPSVFDSTSGRPHYPVYAHDDGMFNTTKVVHNVFSGEASTEEVRALVREASMLAERSAKQPYNEWLCRLHRAYENAALWQKLLVETSEYDDLREPSLKISVAESYRLPLVPGDPYTYYVLDNDRTPESYRDSRYAIYKRVTLKTVPKGGSMFDTPDYGRYYTPEKGQELPARLAHMEFKVKPKAGKMPTWPDNIVYYSRGFDYFRECVRPNIRFRSTEVLKNYILALNETDKRIFSKIDECGKDRDPEIHSEAAQEKNQYTLVRPFHWSVRTYPMTFFLATQIEPPAEGWLFADGFVESKGEDYNLLDENNKLSQTEIIRFFNSLTNSVVNIKFPEWFNDIEFNIPDSTNKSPKQPVNTLKKDGNNDSWIFGITVGEFTVKANQVMLSLGKKNARTQEQKVIINYKATQPGDDEQWIEDADYTVLKEPQST